MKRIMILVTATLLVIGSTLNAQPGMGHPNGKESKEGAGFNLNKFKCEVPGGMNRIDRIKTILKLTDEQEARVRDIKFDNDNNALDLKNGIAKNRLVIQKMMMDNKIEQEKLLSLTSANSESRNKMRLSKIKMWLEVYNILDNTQKEQWTKMFGRMGQKGFRKGDCGGYAPSRMH